MQTVNDNIFKLLTFPKQTAIGKHMSDNFTYDRAQDEETMIKIKIRIKCSKNKLSKSQ